MQRFLVAIAAFAVVPSASSSLRADTISGVFGGGPLETAIYSINITDPTAFSATLVNAGTTTNLDTMLFLLDANKKAVEANDDTFNSASAYDPRSTLSAGNPFSPTTAGEYYLAISVFQNVPYDALGNSLFSPVPTGEGVVGPNPLAGSFDHFVQIGTYGGEVLAGAYQIDLVGASPTPVPSTFLMSSILFGMVGMVWSYKRFKQTTVAA